MFRVKICGVRVKSDIDAVAAVGGDAVGFNFFSPSVRYLDPGQSSTKELSEHATGRGLLRVGVFVNESAVNVDAIAEQVGLDAVQLHGDETVGSMMQLSAKRKLRAIKLPTSGLTVELIDAAVRPWIDAGFHPLLDADAGTQHGGSGKTLDWSVVGRWAKQNPRVAWTLAGGLTPENVAEAMRISGATSVDTASGVEQPKGTKSPERIQEFVDALLC